MESRVEMNDSVSMVPQCRFVAFSPTAPQFVTVMKNGTEHFLYQYFNKEKKQPIVIGSFIEEDEISDLEFSPCGTFFVSQMIDGKMKLYSNDGTLMKEMHFGIKSTFKPANMCIGCNSDAVFCSEDNVLRILCLHEALRIFTKEKVIASPYSFIVQSEEEYECEPGHPITKILTESDILVVGSDNGFVQAFEMYPKFRKLRRFFTVNKIRDMALSNDRRMLAVCGEDESIIKLFDILNATPSHYYSVEYSGPIQLQTSELPKDEIFSLRKQRDEREATRPDTSIRWKRVIYSENSEMLCALTNNNELVTWATMVVGAPVSRGGLVLKNDIGKFTSICRLNTAGVSSWRNRLSNVLATIMSEDKFCLWSVRQNCFHDLAFSVDMLFETSLLWKELSASHE